MIILHGDNQVASRSELTKLKRGAPATELEGNSLDLATLVQSCSAVDLFRQPNLIVIVGLFSRRSSSTKQQLIDYLLAHQGLAIIIWEPKDVSAQLTPFAPSIVRKFALPQPVFAFLDSLTLPALQLALRSVPAELVCSLLSGHIHKLLLVKSAVGTFPPWQLSKLKSTAARFTLAQLTQLHTSLTEIDYRQKTGDLPSSLAQSLEVLIATL